MISLDEYEKLVFEVVGMEAKLRALGRVVVCTADGSPYAMSERLLINTVPEQKEYNDYLLIYNEKKDIVEAHDKVARYALSLHK